METAQPLAAAVSVRQYEVMPSEDERTARLMQPELRNGYFETQSRPARDRSWSWAFLIANLVVLCGGIAAFVRRDPEFFLHISDDFLKDPAVCTPGRALSEEPKPPVNGVAFAFAVLGGCVGAVLMGVGFTYLLKKRTMVAVSVATFAPPLLWFVSGAAAFAAGAPESATMPIILGAVWCIITCMIWSRLELVGRLLKIAAQGLSANPGLIPSSLSICAVTFVFFIVQAAFTIAAYMNGDVVANPEWEAAMPCMWQPKGWAVGFMVFSLMVMVWTAAIGEQANVYVTGGTISQWYFAPEGASTRGTTMRALGYAMRSSAGSLCIAGAVLALINIARNITEGLKRRFGICCSILLQWLLSMMSLFTKFSVIRMAISGEGFFAAAGEVRDLLLRNAHDAYTVWWAPVFVLRGFAIIASLTYGILVGLASTPLGCPACVIVGAVSFYVSAVILLFVSNILLSVVDTVFICWVMDCDRKMVTHVEVHQVFAEVPLSKPSGLAVQQPDGSYAYAPQGSMAENATQMQDNAMYTPPSQVAGGHVYPQGYAAVPQGDVETGRRPVV